MKKNLLPLVVTVFCLGFLLVNCSDDSTESVIYNDTGSFEPKSLQPGINIGYIDQDGNDFVYNDSVAFIKAQWERDYGTTITSFRLQKKLTIPNPDIAGDQGGNVYYLLIGETTSGTHIAMSVEPVLDLTFVRLFLQQVGSKPIFTVSCSGCSEGCSIAKMLTNNGNKYLCSDPCANCSKTETLTDVPY